MAVGCHATTFSRSWKVPGPRKILRKALEANRRYIYCFFVCVVANVLKVRQSRNDFFKPTFPPKNKWTNSTLLLWNLMSTCFHSFLEEIENTKNISKSADLYQSMRFLAGSVDRVTAFLYRGPVFKSYNGRFFHGRWLLWNNFFSFVKSSRPTKHTVKGLRGQPKVYLLFLLVLLPNVLSKYDIPGWISW